MKNIQLILLSTAISLLTIHPAVVNSAGNETFGYSGATGPANWARLSPANELCGSGRQQSPVNIPSGQIKTDVFPKDFSLPPLQQFEVSNDGHHLVFTPKDSASRGMTIDGERYNLTQFHVHTRSEHRVNNIQTPAEIHFVHKSGDKISVVGVFVQEGATNNAWTSVLRRIPGANAAPVSRNTSFLPANIPNLARRGVFTYSGSLTVPPCTEGVRWFVLRTPITMSSQQIRVFARVGGPSSRPLQNNITISRNSTARGSPTTNVISTPKPRGSGNKSPGN